MDTVLYARALMGISLAFHIVYATLGVGLPLLLMLAEGLSLVTGKEEYHTMARGWIRSASVLFAIGAVSGTILSFELGFLWPEFMSFAGGLIGPAFTMEGFAFFTEAIFLGIYLYGTRRLSRRAQFLATIPIAVASAASAAFVISANAWMNTPVGFEIVNGQLANVNPLAAFFNPAWAHEAIHGTLAAYAATGVAVAGYYALALLRGNRTRTTELGLMLAMSVSLVVVPLMLVSGDNNARFIAENEKPKLAAAEGLFHTTAQAPLTIGGIPNLETETMDYGIALPGMLSLLAFHDFNATVTGLDAFPKNEIPDPRLVHPAFDVMIGSFGVMMLALALFWWRRWRDKRVPQGRWTLWAVLGASPFGIIALEAGWLVTEFGRQPWIITQYMRVEQAVTPRGEVGLVLALFLGVYVALTIGLILLLRPGRKQAAVLGEIRHASS